MKTILNTKQKRNASHLFCSAFLMSALIPGTRAWSLCPSSCCSARLDKTYRWKAQFLGFCQTSTRSLVTLHAKGQQLNHRNRSQKLNCEARGTETVSASLLLCKSNRCSLACPDNFFFLSFFPFYWFPISAVSLPTTLFRECTDEDSKY